MDVRLLDSLTPTERRVLRLVHHSRKTDAIAPLVGLSLWIGVEKGPR